MRLLYLLFAIVFIFISSPKSQSSAGNEDENIFSLRLLKSVTPSDSDSVKIQARYPRAIYVAVKGSVSITTLSGTNITIDSLACCMWHPIMFKRVRSTGTTATGILAGR